MKSKEMEKELKDVAKIIYDYTVMPFNPNDTLLPHPKSLGSGLVISYLSIKVVNFLNVMFNFWMMNSFLSRGQNSLVMEVFGNVLTGFKWEIPKFFPRVT
jgi:hypothetical protein